MWPELAAIFCLSMLHGAGVEKAPTEHRFVQWVSNTQLLFVFSQLIFTQIVSAFSGKEWSLSGESGFTV